MTIFSIVIDALNRADARYVVVGGLAGNLHGHVRFTSDIDIVIDLTPRSARRAVDAISNLGFASRVGVTADDFSDPVKIRSWIEEKSAKVISFTHPEHPTFAVDILLECPLPFETLFEASKLVPLGAISARIACLSHLIEMKEKSARPQDLVDLEVLRNIHRGI